MVPPGSVEAVHDKLIWVFATAVAVKFVGTVGVATGVEAVAVIEYGPRLVAASVARTR